MAEIKIDELNMTYQGKKVKLMRKAAFAKSHCNGISNQALDYAIKKDLIDYTKLEKSIERLIVLTDKTMSYTPREDGGTSRMEP